MALHHFFLHCVRKFRMRVTRTLGKRTGHTHQWPPWRAGIHLLVRPVIFCLRGEAEGPQDADSGWMCKSRLDYLFLILGSWAKPSGKQFLITDPRASKASPGHHEAALASDLHSDKSGGATESRESFLSIRSYPECCLWNCLESGLGRVPTHPSYIDCRVQGCASSFLLLRSIPKSRLRPLWGCFWNRGRCAPSVTSNGIGGPQTQMGRARAYGCYVEPSRKHGAATHFPEFRTPE